MHSMASETHETESSLIDEDASKTTEEVPDNRHDKILDEAESNVFAAVVDIRRGNGSAGDDGDDHEDEEEENDEIKQLTTLSPHEEKPAYLDHGWAWLVMIGGFGMHVLVTGLYKSFGVLFVEFEDKFHASAKTLGLAHGITVTLMFAIAFISNSLATVLGTRVVVFMGGVFCSLGLVLTSFIPNIEWLYLTYCTITGIGGALAYTPSLIMVTLYFDKHISKANGFSVAGGGVGSMLMPLLLRSTVDSYGLRGCLLIVGGVILNTSVFAMFFRPIPTNEESSDGSKSLVTSFTQVVKSTASNLIDVGLLKSPEFLVYTIANTIANLGYSNVFLIMPGYAEMVGISRDMSAALIAIVGFGDLFGRIVFGIIMDTKHFKTRKRLGFIFGLTVSGVSTMFAPLLTTLPTLVGYALIYGLFSGCYVTLIAVVYKEVFGKQQRKALGMTFIMNAPMVLLGPTIVGVLKDETKTWVVPLLFSGAALSASALLLMFEPLVMRYSRAQTVPTSTDNRPSNV